jgi:CRP/FNR family cyclic AMP-dependent transcriptional regulator
VDRTNSAAMTGTPLRLGTTTTMSRCEIIRLEPQTVVRLLHENQEFADYFLAHLLTRTARVEADLVDQLFNSSVNVFMNKFRKLGLIKYNGTLEVQKALLNFVLNERPHIEP